jgi:hypothetical protein
MKAVEDGVEEELGFDFDTRRKLRRRRSRHAQNWCTRAKVTTRVCVADAQQTREDAFFFYATSHSFLGVDDASLLALRHRCVAGLLSLLDSSGNSDGESAVGKRARGTSCKLSTFYHFDDAAHGKLAPSTIPNPVLRRNYRLD